MRIVPQSQSGRKVPPVRPLLFFALVAPTVYTHCQSEGITSAMARGGQTMTGLLGKHAGLLAAAAIAALAWAAGIAAEPRRSRPCRCPSRRGPSSPPSTPSSSTSAPSGSATPSSASGPTGGRRPCPWWATGTPATCTSRASGSTRTTSNATGHPSKHGYKDIIPLWKAEKWDPDRLMALYKKAGARYFVSMGCHHDNFDLWNSKFHTVERRARWARSATWSATGRRPPRSRACGSASPSTWAPASPGSRPATAPTRPARWPACPTTGPTRSTQDLYHFPAAARRHRLVQQEPQLAAGVVQPHQGPGGPVPPGPALHRRRRALRQRGRPQHDRPPLQRQRRQARRQAAGRLHLQAGIQGHVGRGPGARRHARHPARRPGRPTPPSATGSTTRTGSTAAPTG